MDPYTKRRKSIPHLEWDDRSPTDLVLSAIRFRMLFVFEGEIDENLSQGTLV